MVIIIVFLIFIQSQETPRKVHARERALERRLDEAKRSYYTLAGIAIELIEALEAAVAGKMVWTRVK